MWAKQRFDPFDGSKMFLRPWQIRREDHERLSGHNKHWLERL
jgi:hypothetical protein